MKQFIVRAQKVIRTPVEFTIHALDYDEALQMLEDMELTIDRVDEAKELFND